jgi:hypothetical protein
MEVYKRETREVVRRFLLRQMTFPRCIAALDAALAALIPSLRSKDLPELRAFMLANNEKIMAEMARRAAERKAKPK